MLQSEKLDQSNRVTILAIEITAQNLCRSGAWGKRSPRCTSSQTLYHWISNRPCLSRHSVTRSGFFLDYRNYYNVESFHLSNELLTSRREFIFSIWFVPIGFLYFRVKREQQILIKIAIRDSSKNNEIFRKLPEHYR
jgi:hypothetical protein